MVMHPETAHEPKRYHDRLRKQAFALAGGHGVGVAAAVTVALRR